MLCYYVMLIQYSSIVYYIISYYIIILCYIIYQVPDYIAQEAPTGEGAGWAS